MDMWCSRLPGGRSWLSLLFEVSRLLSTVCIENILERWTSSNWLARKEYFKEGKLARKGYHVCAGLADWVRTLQKGDQSPCILIFLFNQVCETWVPWVPIDQANDRPR
jgi:hypothetical protein